MGRTLPARTTAPAVLAMLVIAFLAVALGDYRRDSRSARHDLWLDLVRRRMAAWDTEWRATGPRWTVRT